MRRPAAAAVALAGLLLGGGAAWLWLAGKATPDPEPAAGPTTPGGTPHAFVPGEPPRLLPARPADPARPPLAWERLLAADGSPSEDLASVRDLVDNHLHSGLGGAGGGRGIAFNEDLVPALTDRDALGEVALPADHPAIREGRLIDRWGTPWQVHPLAGDLVQLRSAGPDRRLYTTDDLVAPEDR
jgi:hypothetical protein